MKQRKVTLQPAGNLSRALNLRSTITEKVTGSNKAVAKGVQTQWSLQK